MMLFMFFSLVNARVHELMSTAPDHLKRISDSNSEAVHEIVIAVQQRNIDVIEEMLLRKSNPGIFTLKIIEVSRSIFSIGHDEYRKWLTYEEVGALTTNEAAHTAITFWLDSEVDISTEWVSPRLDYIKARAPIHVWERLLTAKYSKYKDLSKDGEVHYNVADKYSLPDHLTSHIQHIFGTVQFPPRIADKHVRIDRNELSENRKLRVRTTSTTPVTVSYLNSLYGITSNYVSNPTFTQAVFETNNESFSQYDLLVFQSYYGLTVQAAQTPYGHAAPSSACFKYGNCGEGNLDVQYMMGVAQNVPTIYWYTTSTTNVFLSWILAVSSATKPPLVNSISWGQLEIVSKLTNSFSSNYPFTRVCRYLR
jgi:hypothetical protein